MRLAIFDLDNTLLAGDSDHAWGEFLISRKLVDEVIHRTRNDRFYRDYQQGRLNVHDYVRFTLEPVLRLPLAELAELHREFMEDYINPIILPRAVELVKQHREQNDYCLIITATNRFITEPIARCFAVDTLLATDLVVESARYTGAIDGVPCFQAGKVERLEHWIRLRNDGFKLKDSVFYTDSHNDLPLLRKVRFPIAVDPDPELKEIANNNAWKVISLRQRT
ncbi:MAG: HAD family hydrolase [Pseudohongiellaceae bacterium]